MNLVATIKKLSNQVAYLYNRLSNNTASVAFSESIPFNAGISNMAAHTVDGPITFTPNTTDAAAWNSTGLRLTADGTNSPLFSGFKKSKGSQLYDNTNGTLNVILFWYDGVDYWYNIYQEFQLTQLNVPGSFAAGSLTSSSANLTWTDTNTDPQESGIVVEVASDSGFTTIVQTLTPAVDSTSVAVNTLNDNTQYWARIKAVGDNETTSDSVYDDITFTTEANVVVEDAAYDQLTGTNTFTGAAYTVAYDSGGDYYQRASGALNWGYVVGRSTKKLATGDDGGHHVSVPDYGGIWTPNIIWFNTSTTRVDYTAAPIGFRYASGGVGGFVFPIIAGAEISGATTSLNFTESGTERVGIFREGSDFKIKKSLDSGSTWSTVYTFNPADITAAGLTSALAGDLYAQADCRSSIKDPKIINFS